MNLEIRDYRWKVFRDEDAKQVLADVAAKKFDQVQVRCDSQQLCDAVRARLHHFALADGRQFEMTILGMGAAVGVKMHMPAQYVYDEKTNSVMHRDEYTKKYGEGKV